MPDDDEYTDEHAIAVASLTATVRALNDTTRNGFAGLSHRLDTQNGRLRVVENDTTEIRAKMVTTKVCERIRGRIAKTRGRAWRSYFIPTAVALTVLFVRELIR